MAILPIRRKLEVTRLKEFHGGFVGDPLFEHEAAEMINMEVTRDGILRTILGSTRVNSTDLGGVRVLSVFVGQAGNYDFVVMAHLEDGTIWAATSNEFPATFTNITGAAVLTGTYFSFVQTVNAANNRIIVFSNDTDGMYQWTGAGNISAIAGAPAAKMVTQYQNHVLGIVSPNQIHFSEYQDPSTWPAATNVFEISGEAGELETAISLPGKVVLICREGIFYLLGATLDEFQVQKIYPNLGTIYPRTAVSYGQLAAFMSSHGPYMVAAGSSDVQYIGEQLREYFSGQISWSPNFEEATAFMNQNHIIFTMMQAGNATTVSFVYDIRYKSWWKLNPPGEIAPLCWSPSHALAVGSGVYWAEVDRGSSDGRNPLSTYTGGVGGDPTLSGNGRYVGWVNGTSVYVRDMSTGQLNTYTFAGGSLQNMITFSFDGRYMFLDYAPSGTVYVYKYDVLTNTATIVSTAADGTVANASCLYPWCSADGRFVVFESTATNLHPDATAGGQRIFLKDTLTGDIFLVSRIANGGAETQGNFPVISGDGRFVAFYSNAAIAGLGAVGTDDVFLYDHITRDYELISQSTGGVAGDSNSRYPRISGDASRVIFASDATNLVAGDTNAVTDLFLRDRAAGTTTRLSVSTAGVEGNAAVYGGGFHSISFDGKYAVFTSAATNMVAGDTNGKNDVFLRDIAGGTTTRISVSTDSGQATDNCATGRGQSISYDGQYVLFSTTNATNLVEAAEDATMPSGPQAYIRDRINGVTGIVSYPG